MEAKKEQNYESYIYSDSSNTSNAMKMYLKEIEEYPMLSAKEEVELAKAIIDSSEEAKEKFINANYRLVVSIAKRYRKESITRYIDDCENTIRIPVHLHQRINFVKRKKQELANVLQREPSMEELAEVCELEVDKVLDILKRDKNIVSLDTPIKEDEDSSLVEFIPSDAHFGDVVIHEVEQNNLREKIDEVLTDLSDQEQQVLRMRFGLDDDTPKTLEEIGKVFGVTRERIRQIEAKAIRKLRHPSRLKLLKNFY